MSDLWLVKILTKDKSTGVQPYKRILLKLSGEALQDKSIGRTICPEIIRSMACQVKEIRSKGVEVSIVIGGGNLFRGLKASAEGMDRTTADYMGMMATIINALALQEGLEKEGVQNRVLSALEVNEVAEPFIRRRAIRHLEKGRVVIFAGGTGNPFFTTDTAAVLRAAEIGAEIIFKATRVDGVYDSDPEKNENAKRFDTISYMDVLNKQLKVMDTTAISLCMDNSLPICVFDSTVEGNIVRAVSGENIGTFVSQ